MPYDNAYNRGIAQDLNAFNERFATLYGYSPVDGRGGYSEGGSNAGVLFQMGNASKRDGEDNVYNDDLALPPVYYYGQDAEGLEGGNGFAAGTFRDTGEGSQLGVSATGHFDGAAAARSVAKYEGSGSGYQGGNLFTDIYHGFEDLGSDIGSAVDYVIGSAKPKKQKLRALGRLLAHSMQHKLTGGAKAQAAAESLAGGSWWDSLKEGVSDVVSFLPDLAIHAIAGKKPDPLGGSAGPKGSKPRKMRGGDAAAAEVSPPTGAGASGGAERQIGGAILGNPDGYPRMGDSARIAGRGQGKKVGGAKALEGPNGDLLAMPGPALANGVPPRAQLRGSYGGAKPAELTKEAVIKAVKAKLKGKGAEKPEKPESHDVVHIDFEKGSIPKIKGGKNLSGMTDKRAEAAPAAGGAKGTDGRKRRAEIVKRVMQERGLKLIEASKYVKAHNLYHA